MNVYRQESSVVPMLGDLSSVLSSALLLYFDTRVLRLYFGELELLRRLLWRLAVDCYLIDDMQTQTPSQLHDDDENSNVVGVDIGIGAHSHKKVISCKPFVHELMSAIQCGRSLGVDDHSIVMNALRSRVHFAETVIADMGSIAYIGTCDRVDKIAEKNTYIHRLETLLSNFSFVETSFMYARMRCHVLGLRPRSADGASDVYCWCGCGDDGSAMVCCDACDVWFHWRCVGIGKGGTAKGKAKAKGKVIRNGGGKVTNKKRVIDNAIVDINDIINTHDNSIDNQNDNEMTDCVDKKDDEPLDGAYLCIFCSEIKRIPHKFAWN